MRIYNYFIVFILEATMFTIILQGTCLACSFLALLKGMTQCIVLLHCTVV